MNKNNNNSWYKKQIVTQRAYLNDLVDWTDDNTVDNAVDVMSPQIVDFDELERQRAQATPLEQGELQSISEEQVGDYMVDDLLEQDEQDIRVQNEDKVEEGYFDGTYIPSEDELQEMGIEPVEDTGEVVDESPDDVPDFGADHASALQWAIENNRVVKLSYLTLGKKRGRGGKRYLKREMTDERIPGTGVNIWRIVEPHHVFSSNNGHEVLVTYDRSVRHIRAFRVENVTNVDFVKKRMTNEPSYFKPRVRIKSPGRLDQSGKIKGIEAMNVNIFQELKRIGDDLEGKGLDKTASVITSTMSNLLNIKTAQYVGPQGYWIRQKRCWDNCYRQKRTTSPNKAAQVVWTECWEEYNKSINDNKSGWEKYAQEDTDLFKYASQKQKDWVANENNKFANSVEDKVASGDTQGMAIYHTLEEKKDEYNRILLADADTLTKLAEQIKENGQDELSEKLAEVSVELLKEAQFGGGFEGALNKMRKYNPFSGKSRAKGRVSDIITRLKNITQQALQMANKFNTIKQQARQSGQSEVGYQKGQTDLASQQQAKQQGRADMINKVKATPGQAFNWAKDKVNQLGMNPAVQQAGRALGESKLDVKIAQANNPAFQTGMEEFARQLRDEFQTFMENIRKESSAMSQMAAKATDADSKQKASQVAKRMMQFIQKATPFEQSFYKKNEMVLQGDALVKELQNFANDVNMIQVGQYNESAPQSIDTDGDGYPDVTDPDDNNGVADVQEVNTQATAIPIDDNLLAKAQASVQSGQALTEQDFNTLKNYVMSIRDEKAKFDSIMELYSKATDLKSRATRVK